MHYISPKEHYLLTYLLISSFRFQTKNKLKKFTQLNNRNNKIHVLIIVLIKKIFSSGKYKYGEVGIGTTFYINLVN